MKNTSQLDVLQNYIDDLDLDIPFDDVGHDKGEIKNKCDQIKNDITNALNTINKEINSTSLDKDLIRRTIALKLAEKIYSDMLKPTHIGDESDDDEILEKITKSLDKLADATKVYFARGCLKMAAKHALFKSDTPKFSDRFFAMFHDTPAQKFLKHYESQLRKHGLSVAIHVFGSKERIPPAPDKNFFDGLPMSVESPINTRRLVGG